LGLGPDDLLARNPRLVYVSMSGLGASGPRSQWVSFNAVIQALSGLMLVTGRPDDPPIGVSNSWADFMAGLHAAVIVMSALAWRDQDGHGGWIDLSQYEANALPLGHLVARADHGDLDGHRMGNRSERRVPQDCYRCAGADAWCVISVETEAQWAALTRVIGDRALLDARFDTLEGRRAAADAIDRRIEAWTRERAAGDVERALQAAGVPAAAVRTNVEVLAELAARAPSFRMVDHPAVGAVPMLPNPIRIDGSPGRLNRPGPRIGEHTREVLGDVLGMVEVEIERLRAAGALA
jgi:crotonobetainyl-CoA:carnitine CoA-transferase CaiB-like acyl-CoA transferase